MMHGLRAHYDARRPGWQVLDAAGRLRERVQYARAADADDQATAARAVLAAAFASRETAADHRPRVLVCDHYIPTPDRDAGSVRMAWILRLLASMCSVTFVAERRYAFVGYAWPLLEAGVEVVAGDGRSFERLLAERPGMYDAVILSRTEVANRCLPAVRRHQPRARVVFDTVELTSIRLERQRNLEGVRGRSLARELQLEARAIRHSDVVLTVSEDERAEVARRGFDTETIVMPFVHTVSDRPRPEFDTRRDLLFVGNFTHTPNADAVRWFAHDVLPRIRSSVDVTLRVAGPGASRETAAAWGPHVAYEGWVPELQPLFDSSRLTVAPLRYGAGVKGKVGESLAMGLPCVATSVGAEGMDLVHGTHLLVADDPSAFADAVLRAYTDVKLWKSLSDAGVAVASERWSPPAMSARLSALLQGATAERRANSAAATLSRSSPTVDVSITCGSES